MPTCPSCVCGLSAREVGHHVADILPLIGREPAGGEEGGGGPGAPPHCLHPYPALASDDLRHTHLARGAQIVRVSLTDTSNAPARVQGTVYNEGSSAPGALSRRFVSASVLGRIVV